MFKQIEFHPMRVNVLDAVGRTDLVTRYGDPVTLMRNTRGEFIITIAGKVYTTDDNLEASGYLWNNEVGTNG